MCSVSEPGFGLGLGECLVVIAGFLWVGAVVRWFLRSDWICLCGLWFLDFVFIVALLIFVVFDCGVWWICWFWLRPSGFGWFGLDWCCLF